MAGLKLSFLGSPRVERDGEPLEIGASKALALLVYLAITGQSHSRDTLSTLLWPESDQSSARAYLRHALWALKKELGERWLQSSRKQIGFQTDEAVWLDVRAFQMGIEAVEAHDHAIGQMCTECLTQLEEAVALYADDFLAGFTLPDASAFDEWQFFQAEALRQLLAGALERLVEEYSVRQEYDAGIFYARRWLAVDPLREAVQRTLMRLYALTGQQGAALRQYEACVRLLDEELGLEPEAETTALYEAIRTRQLEAVQVAMRAEPLPVATRYVIEELLDRGAHGEVYRGRDQQTAEPVIIKRLRPEAVRENEGLVARFVQEGEALSQLNHPNIVRMLGAFEREGEHHLVMEWVAGGSLAERLRHEPQLSLPEVLDIALELADALSRAHHLNIVHRDVKPENVLLAADGTPRLTDFGVARLAGKEGRLTETGMLVGTPAYMSPEVLQGAEPDTRSDIWSFGVLLFEMLAGQRPFFGEQVTSLLVSILNDPVPDVREFRHALGPALPNLLARMLVKEPDRRLGSMRLVAAELERIREAVHVEQEIPFSATAAPAPFTIPASDETVEPEVSGATASPFVAREQELARLDELLETAVSGQPCIAFILGEAGQGKTALLRATARRAQEVYPELVVAGGNCNAYTGLGDPYLPFREILALLTGDLEAGSLTGTLHPDHARRIQRLLPETARALVETAPDLIDTFVSLAGLLERTATARFARASWRQELLNRASSKSDGTGVGLQQNALLDSYSRLLQAVTRQVPLLLLLDDLQWADPGSVSLLFHLGRRLTGCPIMLVAAYRPDEVAVGQEGEPHPLARVVSELQRVHGNVLIDLGQAEGQAFIDAWLDHEPNRLQRFFRQILYRQTGGHPLFTIELLRAMQERGDLWQDADGVWEVETDINWNTMPARVEGAIGERINRLEPALQELVQVASVEGEEFTAEVVAQVLGLDEREVVRRLSRELDKVHALVQAIGMRRVGERRLSRYRFRHILIQRYLYNTLDDVERFYQHEAVGNALEMLHAEKVAEVAVQLARHFEIVQLPEKAAGYLHLAGDQARRTAALTEAIRFYQASLAQGTVGDKGERATIMRKLGECQWMTGRALDALTTFENSYDLFRELGNIEAGGAIQRLIGRVYWEVGEREKSLHHYHQALSILEPLVDSVELAWAISSIAQMHMLAGEHDQAIVWGERALALAGRLEAEAVIVHALNNVGSSYLNRGQVERGRSMLLESVRRALANNMPHDACRGRLNLGEGLASRDLYEEARETLEALYAYAERVHTTLYAGSSLVELARLDWLNGRWRTSLARSPLIEEWLVRGQSMAYVQVIASTVFGQQQNDLGRPEAAYDILQGSLTKVRSFDELQLTSPFLAQMMRALAAIGAEEETIQVARELLAAFADSDYDGRFSTPALLTVCDALTAPIPDELLEGIKEALTRLLEDSRNQSLHSNRAILHEVAAVVALFEEDLSLAADFLRNAVATWQRIERRYDQARGLKKLGEVLQLIGEPEEARPAFVHANVLVGELAAQLDQDELKASFLQSPLVEAIKAGVSAVAA